MEDSRQFEGTGLGREYEYPSRIGKRGILLVDFRCHLLKKVRTV